jgi:hypothetical protein
LTAAAQVLSGGLPALAGVAVVAAAAAIAVNASSGAKHLRALRMVISIPEVAWAR